MRLGLDIGTNSIGWWLYRLHDGRPVETIDCGVRVYTDGRDPQSKESLAKDRRVARAARRRRDRYLRRRTSLMRKLAASGLMPTDPAEAKMLETLDPFQLRARGLDERLTLGELGRALFHLSQRRGFKSNRKAERGDNEGGKIREAAARLDQAMLTAGARTYGEFLHMRRAASPERPPAVRTRLRTSSASDGSRPETGYDFYPERRHLEAEFRKLWAAQARHHDRLDGTLRDALFETIFHQRPLKAPEIGRCLYGDDRRLAKAHPLHQRRVLFETVNHLRICEAGQPDRPLGKEERDRLILALDGKTAKSPGSANVSFVRLRKVLALQHGQSFSLERGNRAGIDCDAVRAVLTHKERYGPGWAALDVEAQWELVERVSAVESDADHAALVAWLQSAHGLNDDRARAVADAPLPQGHGRLGLEATKALLPVLEADVITYDKAAAQVFGHHADFRTGEVLDELPYYGQILDRHVIPGTNDPNDGDVERYGRIANPTVHIGLNQLRRLINLIIRRHGLPERIVVELSRELKLSEAQKREVNKVIRRNTDAAKARGEKLVELGLPDNGANRLILRLWEEQGEDPLHRFCPYSGATISAAMLFGGEVEVDHILPYSRTLDDSVANRVLCRREANRDKRDRSPWEAWGGTSRWATIEPLIAKLPANKRWRFGPDAMARFEDEHSFLARQLVDTQYLSRISREYLSRLYPEPGSAPVYVVPGRMTEMLRRRWGLNFDLSVGEDGTGKEKNRSDHRHHAIDAAVVGATDQALMQRIQRAAGRREAHGLDDVIGDVEPPYEGFRAEVRAHLDAMVVSHRPDRGRIDRDARHRGRDTTSGRLHNDTAYGLTGDRTRDGVPIVVHRKPLSALTPGDIPRIRDPQLVAELENATRGLSGKAFEAALSDFAEADGPYRGIRRVRLTQPQKVIEIADARGRPYKAYKGDSNHCYDVWRLPDGSWERVVVSSFDAHQAELDRRPHPAAKRLMRLHKRDLIALEHPRTGFLIAVVAKLGEARLDLAPHNEADVDRRARDKRDPFDYLRVSLSTLRKCGARPVHVDEMGRLHDPGPFDART